MELHLSSVNWYAVIACLVFGQAFLSLWFIVLFGTPWAKAYGVSDQKQHTKEVPGYTYAIQALCTALLIFAIANLQVALSVQSLGSGILLGLWIALFYSVATALPGYAFLKRWNAFWMAMGSQAVLIVVVSAILAVWK